MKKLMLVSILILFLPLFLNAQDDIKKEINNFPDKNTQTLQELNSNLLDQYGINNLKYVKLEEGKYIPVKVNEVKRVNDVKGVMETMLSQDVIIIFAIIGAILVGFLIIKAL
ncbi:MAG: hypothetical protein JW917_04145 [Ignavibacteria bacterium]|nr:hypothetical protein [Ignavibacteria bacterium]